MAFRTFNTDVKRLIRYLRLESSDDRYRAEGRVKVDAKIVYGAPEGWFLPGNGKVEWFKDHEMGTEMVVVPAGSFKMGEPGGQLDGPQHLVTIARPFSIGRHAVTRGQFGAFVNETDYKTEGGAVVWNAYPRYMPVGMQVQEVPGSRLGHDLHASWRNPGFSQEENHPVVCVSWEDAKAFAAWLSGRSGRGYRLLTEAEWEYAARAGTTTPFWWGSSVSPGQANYDGRSFLKQTFAIRAKDKYREQTVAVGEFAANPWGLYQVHGNVREWCEDVWHENYNEAPPDGSAWVQGGHANSRVNRGGSWVNDPEFLRSAGRNGDSTDDRVNNLGFRVGRTLTP